METCELLPATKRLKQLIKEFGNRWEVAKTFKPCQAFGNDLGMFIVSQDGQHHRWVRPEQVILKGD